MHLFGLPRVVLNPLFHGGLVALVLGDLSDDCLEALEGLVELITRGSWCLEVGEHAVAYRVD